MYDITKERAKLLARAAFNWCIDTFGVPDGAKRPKLLVTHRMAKREKYGHYGNGLITIFATECETEARLIKVVLHEYKHFLQMPNDNDLSKFFEFKGEYKKNPLEIEADEFSKANYRRCRYRLKKDGIL